MHRLLEIILGLEKGFLGKEGDFSLQFNPRWPGQELFGAATWNVILGALALALVIYVYRHESRSRLSRIVLGTVRALLLAFVLAMLNRPVVTLTQSRTEPSVLAIVMDDSLSMKIRDAQAGGDSQGKTRFAAMLDLLNGEHQKLLRDLSRRHIVKFYKFDSDAQEIATLSKFAVSPANPAEGRPEGDPVEAAAQTLSSIKPEGKTTQVLASVRTVLDDLQGQRLAAVVLLTDGRSSPAESAADGLGAIEKYGVRIYPVAVGSEKPPRNLAIEGIAMEEAAFAKDLVAARVSIRSTGFPPGTQVPLVLKNRDTGAVLTKADGKSAEETVTINGDGTQEVEVTYKPTEVGTLNVVAELARQAGEIDDEDNSFPAQIAILDARISVLYCEGYPRWEYRYIKNEMTRRDIRDRENRESPVQLSCLLFSADSGFAQEGNKPITRFPESITELLEYDVVLFGDVDSRQFTDHQLQLIHDFVLKKNGGFGMVAGPRYAPYSFRSTPIEPILPVNISRAAPDDNYNITAGWRPVLTKAGQSSMMFRFIDDKALNEKYLREEIQPLFWYCRGITAKRDVGEVYAEHPNDTGPDGRKAPILVLGRYGGRTLFSAIDDSWRWRFYTGESVFYTYWTQQLRYLACEKKLGQRRFTLSVLRPSYELGQQIEVHLRILDPDLLGQLSDQISVLITQNGADGAQQARRQETFERRAGQNDLYVASWTADKIGRFAMKLPPLAGSVQGAEAPIAVKVPKLELSQPQVDRDMLSKLISKESDPSGPDPARLAINAESDPAQVRAQLLKIPSAEVVVPVYRHELLWNAPLAMVLFVLLITAEWVLRKVYGML